MRFDITPGNLDQFINGLLGRLRSHLDSVVDSDEQRTIINEAHQYLRGAHALCVSTSIGTWPEQGDYSCADGMAGLLNHMFEEGHANMDEIADEALSVFGRSDRAADELPKHTEH